VKLTMSVFTSWHTKIMFQDLPQTIKDAIRVTVALGLEFLWIDALCIVQDDDIDKNLELAKMGEIYSGSQVTLLAARSPSVRDGFLHSRYLLGERSYRIPFRCSNDQLGSLILW
jgi:hypothetical protein